MRPEQAHALAARPAAASSKALIPSLLIFTYKCDLLADQSCVGSDRYSSQNEAVMRDNMWNTIRLHGGEVCTVKGDCPASTCMSCTSNRLPEPAKGQTKAVCRRCGQNEAGVPNCCNSGGDWAGKCSGRGTSKHGDLRTWDEGYDACHGSSVNATNVTIHFYDDAACYRVLEEVAPRPLLERFRVEEKGMYKADICRGAALKKAGGFYFDLDLKARMDSRALVQNDTTFVSVVTGNAAPREIIDSDKPLEFFQAFIGSTPNHPIIDQYLDAMVAWYEDPTPESERQRRAQRAVTAMALPPRSLSAMRATWMGTEAMGTAFQRVQESLGDGIKTQIWHELPLQQLEEGVQQRVPSQGGDLCDYVVYDPESNEVPFYSRARGASDYCA